MNAELFDRTNLDIALKCGAVEFSIRPYSISDNYRDKIKETGMSFRYTFTDPERLIEAILPGCELDWEVTEFENPTPNASWPKRLLLNLCSIIWRNAIEPLAEELLSLGCCGGSGEAYFIDEADYYAPMRVWFRLDVAGIEFHPDYHGLKNTRRSKEFSAQDIVEALPIIEDGIASMKADIERLSSATVDFSALPIIQQLVAVQYKD